jgi:hypothetical protein
MRAMLAASLLTLLPAAVASQPTPAQPPRGVVYLSVMGEPFIAPAGQSALALWLAKADIDRNGSISLAELTADGERFFKTLDIDNDGRIGGFEMTRYEEEIAPASLRARAGMRPVGSDRVLEKDAAGFVDRSRNGRRGRDMLPGGMTRPELSMSADGYTISGGGSSLAIPQPVAMTDADMSGSVTVDEFARAATRRFALVDANKNGLLEAGELSRPAR